MSSAVAFCPFNSLSSHFTKVKNHLASKLPLFAQEVPTPAQLRCDAKKINFTALSQKAAEELNQEWQTYLSQIVHALQAEKLPAKDKQALKTLFEHLNINNLELFFKHFLTENIDHGLLDNFFSVLSLEKLEDAIKLKDPTFSLKEFTCFAKGMPYGEAIKSASSQHKNSSSTNILTQFFPNLAHIFVKAFDLFDSARPPESLYEYGVLAGLYFHFFSIPNKLFVALNTVIANPWHVFLAASTVLGMMVGLFYTYLKWFKKCPDKVVYCENLSKKWQEGQIQKVLGREEEYAKVLGYLKNGMNVILIGHPGVGKTEFMQGLAARLPDKKIFKIQNWALSGSGGSVLSAGEKMEMAFKEVRGYEEKVLFCFDELGDSAQDKNLIPYLKLALPNKQLVAAMTEEQWKKIKTEMVDKGFEERFKEVDLMPFQDHDTLHILQQRLGSMSEAPLVSQAALQKIIEITNEREKDHAQPRKAIRALETVLSTVQTDAIDYNKPLQQAKENLERLKGQGLAWESPLFDAKQRQPFLEKIAQAQKDADLLENNEKMHEKWRQLNTYIKTFKVFQKHRLAFLHQPANQAKDEEKMVKFLFTNFIALPKLKEMIETLSNELEAKVCLWVDEKNVSEILAPS